MTSIACARIVFSVLAGAAAILINPVCAAAQPAFQLTPIFDVIQAYDTNLLFTPADRSADFQTRVSPGLDTRYDSRLVTLHARYALDADRFAHHPELSAVNGHRASFDLHYYPTRRLAMTADATFVQTHTPGELYVDTAIALRRAAAQRLLLHSSISRELSRTTSAMFEYSLVDDRLAGGSPIESHRAAVRVEHNTSSRATTTLRYEVARFDFAPRTPGTSMPVITSHTLTAGWATNLTHATRIALRGGPRLADGHVMPEVNASVHWLTRALDASLEYDRSQVTLIGVPGLVETNTLAAPIRWVAARRVDVTLSPAVSSLSYLGASDIAYRVRVEGVRAVTSNTSWITAYEADFQQGHIYRIGVPQSGAMARHVISVGVRRSEGRGELRR